MPVFPQELFHDKQHDDVVFIEGNKIVIGFRKILLAITENEFAFFLSLVRYAGRTFVWNESSGQSILMDTPSMSLRLLLNKQELIRLLQMLEGANDELNKMGGFSGVQKTDDIKADYPIYCN